MKWIIPLLIPLLMLTLVVTAAPPTVVIRGHVGAVKGNFLIVWVEDVIQGSLPESGVIEVHIESGGCSGSPHVDKVKVGDFVEVRGYLETVCCRPIIVLGCGDHYVKIVREALEAKIKPLQGCDSEIATGKNVTYIFFLNRDSNVTISLEEPNGSAILYKGFLKKGLYSISRVEGPPLGDRKICILAESNGDSFLYCCPYSVVQANKTEAKVIYRNLTIKVLTEAGYPVRNASIYVDGKFYGLTNGRGMLATNITEGTHEVLVKSEYYKATKITAKPGLLVVKVMVKAPEVKLRFIPDHLNGSGITKLIVEKIGGADISIKVRLERLGNLKVNATELVGTPPFNATLKVTGTGKLVASYGNATAVLSSELLTKTTTERQTKSVPEITTTSAKTKARITTSTPQASIPAPTQAKPSWLVLLPIIALAITLVALIIMIGAGHPEDKQSKQKQNGER